MGLLDGLFRLSKSGSGGLFNQANEHWKLQQAATLAGNDGERKRHILEVICLCQLAISANKNYGDAYVLLTNALLVAIPPFVENTFGRELLAKYAAGSAYKWWTLPYNKRPITKNYELGDQFHRSLIDHIQESQGGSMQAAEARMAEYGAEYGDFAVSPLSFATIRSAIEGFPTPSSQAQPGPEGMASRALSFVECAAGYMVKHGSELTSGNISEIVVGSAKALVMLGLAYGYYLGRHNFEKASRYIKPPALEITPTMKELYDKFAVAEPTYILQFLSETLVLWHEWEGLPAGTRVPSERAYTLIITAIGEGFRLGSTVKAEIDKVDGLFASLMKAFRPDANVEETRSTALGLLEDYISQYPPNPNRS